MLSKIYKYVRALSLDVVLGAVISCLFLGQLLQVELPVSTIMALAFTVWTIYTTDHLWDAHNLKEKALSFRHRFHQQHFKTLRVWALVSFLSVAATCWFLPVVVLRAGLWVGSLVVIYFAMVRTTDASIFKEFSIAIIYGMGVFLAPVALSFPHLELSTIIIFCQFVLLALVNLLEFSFFELELDRKHQFNSAVLQWGRAKTKIVIVTCLGVTFTLSVLSISLWGGDLAILKSQLALTLMSFLLALIIVKKGFFKTHERFRILGDGIFFVPGLLLL